MLIAVTEQWVLTYIHTQNHFIVDGTLSGFRRLCSMVYAHIAAMFGLIIYTHGSHVCYICLTYPCSHLVASLSYGHYIKARQTNYKSLGLLLWVVGHKFGVKFTLSHPPYNSYVTIMGYFLLLIYSVSHILNSSSWNHYHLHHYKSSEAILEYHHWANEITGLSIKNMVKGLSWTVLH